MDELNFGLLGHNIGYSKSADIFMAIFAELGVKGRFDNFDLEPDRFESEFCGLKSDGQVAGLSVTIPYKHRVISLLDELHPVAEALEAVNSIAFQSGQLIGFNTDRDGFGWRLKDFAPRLKHGHAVVLGCGGSAKAAVYSLHTDYEIDRITVLGRSRERLAAFSDSLHGVIGALNLQTDLIHTLPSMRTDNLSIVVNCTPLGGWNNPDQSPIPSDFTWPGGKIYYDLNYNQGNLLVQKAESCGMVALDGSAMLTAQALKSFEIWTGRTVPFEPIYRKVFGN